MSLKLWHDDVRPAPEGWFWAKTNSAAQEVLSHCVVDECSLDHDLGAIPTGDMDPREVMYLQGSAEETGLHLVEWMIANEKVPPIVRIHSWNTAGAKRMADALADADYVALVEPFVMPV